MVNYIRGFFRKKRVIRQKMMIYGVRKLYFCFFDQQNQKRIRKQTMKNFMKKTKNQYPYLKEGKQLNQNQKVILKLAVSSDLIQNAILLFLKLIRKAYQSEYYQVEKQFYFVIENTEQFQSEYEITIEEVYNSVDMNIRGQNSKIHLWDTAGDEKFIFLISQYYRNVMHLSLCMILYKVKPFYLFQLDSKNQKKKSKRMAIYTIGQNLKEKVPKSKTSDFAKNNGMILYEISAKTGKVLIIYFSNQLRHMLRENKYVNINLKYNLHSYSILNLHKLHSQFYYQITKQLKIHLHSMITKNFAHINFIIRSTINQKMQQFKKEDGSKFFHSFIHTMLNINEQFYCYQSIKILLFIVSMSQNLLYLYFPSYESFQDNANITSTNLKILYFLRPELILLKYLPEKMLDATPFIIVLQILIIKFMVYLNINNHHQRFVKKWNQSTPLRIILINVISFYQHLFNAVLHQPLQSIVICIISQTLKQILNFNTNYIALLIFAILIFILIEVESMSLIFICKQSTTLQFIAFEKFLISKIDLLIYALQLIQIVVFGIASINIIVEYFQQIFTLIIAILNIFNQLLSQGFIFKYQRYLLYIINSFLIIYSLFKFIDLMNNVLLILPLLISLIIYADSQQQLNSIYSLFIQNTPTLTLYVYHLLKICNNCHQIEIPYFQTLFIWNQHKFKCKDIGCLCKQSIQFVLDPKQTIIITEPIFKTFIYRKINHIKKIIYSDKQIEKNDVAFYQIVQNTLYIRQGFMMMAIKNFNKILIKFDDQPKDRIIDQPMTQIFSRRRTKSQVDTQIQGIINIQQQKDEKFEKISKNFQISSLELIKVQYRIKQAQIQLNENFSSHVCSPQEYKMSNFIYDYLNNEFDLNEMTSKFINLVKMKIEFYQQLLNSEYLNGNQIFLSMKKFSKNVQYLEKLLLSKYLAYPSAKLRSLILFFYSEIYNNYLKAQNFKKKNNIQQHKFIHRNQSIDFYSDKIGYVLLQLQDDLQNLKIKSFSNNFIKIIGKQNGDDQLHFYQILPEFIKDAHPILVQRFIQSGIARFYRNLSLTFIQQDNGLAKQMEQSFDTIALMNDNKVIFSAIIQDVIDQKAYLLVNVNGLLSGMTFMCLKKLGFTSQEISSVNSFYSFYEIEINQIVPNFRQLIETDFQEQKFDNIKFLFFDITCYSKDIVHKQSLRESKFCKIWQDNQFVKEYLVNLFIMKRNVFGFFYYIIEIESAYQIDCSQQNRNPETIKLSKSNSESGNFDVASLILSLEDNFSERKANLSKQQTIIQTNQVTKHLEFQRNFQPEILSPKGNSKSNLIEKNPQTIYSLQRNYRQYQQDFFCQQPLEYLAEHSSQEMKSQNQNQFDVVYDMNSESSINSIKKPSFIQRLETIERFSSNFNFQQQKILLFFLMLTLSIYFIFSVLILLLLNTDLESKIQDVEMLSFQANIIAPYDRYLGIRAQIYYYQSLYSSQKISIQEQRDLVEPLYSIIGVCYNELKINSFQSLSEKKLKEFFEDLYTNAFFMGTTDNIIYSKNITFREFIHQLLNYQYDYKIIFDKRIPTKGCPCQVFQFSNYFNLQENLEQMSQKILQFSNTKSQQISDKWIKIYIAYLVLCSLLCFLIYWLRSQLNVQIYTIMELVTHIQEQSLQREIENQKALLLNISQKQDLTSLDYPEKQCYDIQEMNVQKENQYYRKQKRKRLNRISNLKSILFSTIFLGFYFFYSSFVIFSSQKFLSQYESTSNFYKLIADLSFRSGNMFLYREMFMLWGNLTYLNKSDGLKLYNLIKIAQNTILEYLEVAPRANQDSLLVSENFINFFQEVQNKDVCSFLDKEYSQVLGQYCLKAFDGSFIKGMLATLTYIRQSIVNQQAMNNFTFRAEDIYYEIEGGQIVSRVFSYMNKQLQKGIITKTENYQFQNQLLSIFFLVALFLILIYFLFFYYNKIKSNLKMMKFSVLLIPSQEIIQNELFEKYIKQIEIKLGYKI